MHSIFCAGGSPETIAHPLFSGILLDTQRCIASFVLAVLPKPLPPSLLGYLFRYLEVQSIFCAYALIQH